MQTIALVCTDDTGEGVLSKPEDPDERFDDMTLIGASFRDPHRLRKRLMSFSRGLHSLSAFSRIELDGSILAACWEEEIELAFLSWGRKGIKQEAIEGIRRDHYYLVSFPPLSLFLPFPSLGRSVD